MLYYFYLLPRRVDRVNKDYFIEEDIMGYYVDLSSITIDEYMEKLKTKTLIPSQKILKDSLEERLNYLKSLGISNVFDLEKTLKKKEKLLELAQAPCLSEEYLTVMLREIKGRQPKPRKLTDFTHIPEDALSKLLDIGIKTTAHLYDEVLTKENRKAFSEKTTIHPSTILELAQLTNLTRIQWVNTTFARVLYEAGYDTIEKVSSANHEVLYKEIKKLNEERNLYKGNIGLNDMKICVEAANEVKQEMEY